MDNNNYLISMDISPAKLFSENGLEPILNEIKKKVDEFEPDVETAGGRKEIASFAHKIAKSKTFIEKMGKELVSKQKAATKLIDNERKRSRDFLDEQRDRARKPLTEWELFEQKRIAEEAARIELEADHTEALAEDDLFNRQREVEQKEAELAKMLEKRRIEEEAVRLEHEREEREELLKKEATAAAKKEAEEAIAAEKEKAIRLEVEAKAEAIRVEQEKKDAVEKAEREKEDALERALQKAEEKAAKIEADRIVKENEERAKIKADLLATQRKAAHHKHRKKIEGEAIVSFTTVLGCTQDEAYELVNVIKNNEIKNVTLNY